MYMKDNPNLSSYDVGDWSYCGDNFNVLSWGEGTTLRIGNFCSVSDNVTILLGGEHRTDWITTYPFNVLFTEASHIKGHPNSKGDVIIKNDVWIGGNSTILSGVNIGNGAVIGTGSVVTKDVPSYGIVAGNPAVLIRYRFPQDVINELEKISWWNWKIDKIINKIPLLLSKDVEKFILDSENI